MADDDGDLGEIFDLDRKGLTKKLVEDMERCMHAAAAAQEELKGVAATASESQFSRREVAAMKRIAMLRCKDKLAAAKAELEALERVSTAIGLDLFGWADASE
jgi:hypothetical protein